MTGEVSLMKATPRLLSCRMTLRLDGVELPALTEIGLEEFIGLSVIGNPHLLRIVLELTLLAQRDDAQQHPFHKRRRHIAVRACGVAALAGAAEIQHVAGRTRHERGRHPAIAHLLYRDLAR